MQQSLLSGSNQQKPMGIFAAGTCFIKASRITAGAALGWLVQGVPAAAFPLLLSAPCRRDLPTSWHFLVLGGSAYESVMCCPLQHRACGDAWFASAISNNSSHRHTRAQHIPPIQSTAARVIFSVQNLNGVISISEPPKQEIT